MVTAEDIGRTNPPMEAFQMACGECYNRMRAISPLVPGRSAQGTVRNFSWMVPTFYSFCSAPQWEYHWSGFKECVSRAVSQLIGAAAVLFRLVLTWDRTKFRYGFTHDFEISLSSKRVDFAVAVVIGGMILAVLSAVILR